MSIPLINEVNKNDINTSIIAIKKDLERINTLLGLNNTEEIDTSIFATKEELEQAEIDLAPVDEVTSGNMHSVTSNAVASGLENLKAYVDTRVGISFVNNSISSSVNTWQLIFNAGILDVGQYKIEWSGKGLGAISIQTGAVSYFSSNIVPTGVGIFNIPSGGSQTEVYIAIFSVVSSCSLTAVITKLY